MTRFVFCDDRSQSALFPERLDDYLTEDNPVRASPLTPTPAASSSQVVSRLSAVEAYVKADSTTPACR